MTREAQQLQAGGLSTPAGHLQSALSAGDERLHEFERHRGTLFSIAYRMLGSVADAEDLVQDAFVRWQQTSLDKVQSPKALLVTIITRLCINQLQSARAKREEYFGAWLPEPLWTEPLHDPADSIRVDGSLSMAFLLLLERLTPSQRAVFLLHEIFDYEYSEISRILDESEDNCRQILRRARQQVASGEARFDPSPAQHEQLLQRFIEASARGEMEGLINLLSSDVTLYADGGGKASAVPNIIHGPLNVARLIFGAFRKFVPKDMTRYLTELNGAPGTLNFVDGHVHAALSIEVADGRIRAIYLVTNPDKLQRLPQHLPGCAGSTSF